jgi:hypothetical protein
MITQEFIKYLFHYNPETGIFTRRVNRASGKVKSGDEVGVISTHGYLFVGINHKKYALHRLAWLYMTGEMPNKHIDHINRTPLDNRWCNLREATNQENSFNCKLRHDNKSGHRGVSYNKLNKSWRVRANFNGVKTEIGSFKDKNDAILAYIEFAKKNFGEFYNNHYQNS